MKGYGETWAAPAEPLSVFVLKVHERPFHRSRFRLVWMSSICDSNISYFYCPTGSCCTISFSSQYFRQRSPYCLPLTNSFPRSQSGLLVVSCHSISFWSFCGPKVFYRKTGSRRLVNIPNNLSHIFFSHCLEVCGLILVGFKLL